MLCRRSLPRAKRIDLRHKSIKGRGSAGKTGERKERVNFSAYPFIDNVLFINRDSVFYWSVIKIAMVLGKPLYLEAIKNNRCQGRIFYISPRVRGCKASHWVSLSVRFKTIMPNHSSGHSVKPEKLPHFQISNKTESFYCIYNTTFIM